MRRKKEFDVSDIESKREDHKKKRKEKQKKKKRKGKGDNGTTSPQPRPKHTKPAGVSRTNHDTPQ